MIYKAADLHGFIEMTSTIECQNKGCRKTDGEWGMDDYDASEIFFKRGWRATRAGNLYCPECAKKKLKL